MDSSYTHILEYVYSSTHDLSGILIVGTPAAGKLCGELVDTCRLPSDDRDSVISVVSEIASDTVVQPMPPTAYAATIASLLLDDHRIHLNLDSNKAAKINKIMHTITKYISTCIGAISSRSDYIMITKETADLGHALVCVPHKVDFKTFMTIELRYYTRRGDA